MQRNGCEVIDKGVIYLFDNEAAAIGFVDCKSNGGTFESCLSKFKGKRKSEISYPETPMPTHPEAAEPVFRDSPEPKHPEAPEPVHPEAAEPTYPEEPEPSQIKPPRPFKR